MTDVVYLVFKQHIWYTSHLMYASAFTGQIQPWRVTQAPSDLKHTGHVPWEQFPPSLTSFRPSCHKLFIKNFSYFLTQYRLKLVNIKRNRKYPHSNCDDFQGKPTHQISDPEKLRSVRKHLKDLSEASFSQFLSSYRVCIGTTWSRIPQNTHTVMTSCSLPSPQKTQKLHTKWQEGVRSFHSSVIQGLDTHSPKIPLNNCDDF